MMSWRIVAQRHTWLLSLLFTSLICEGLSAASMIVYSNIYAALSTDNLSLLWSTILLALGLVTIIAVFQAMKAYSKGRLSLHWRQEIVYVMQKCVFQQLNNAQERPVKNVDQRMTQDTDEFATTVAKIAEAVMIMPLVLAFYVYYLASAIGFLAPILCFVYFLASFAASYHLSRLVTPLVYRQGQLEGDFRLSATHLMRSWSVITLLQGGVAELHSTTTHFHALVQNKEALLRRQLHLDIVLTWFSYAGVIITYAIIGLTILLMLVDDPHSEGTPATSNSAARLVLWSRGSYAAIALISALSKLTDCLSDWSQATGLARRLLEVFVSHDDSDTLSSSSSNKHTATDSFWSIWYLYIRCQHIKRQINGVNSSNSGLKPRKPNSKASVFASTSTIDGTEQRPVSEQLSRAFGRIWSSAYTAAGYNKLSNTASHPSLSGHFPSQTCKDPESDEDDVELALASHLHLPEGALPLTHSIWGSSDGTSPAVRNDGMSNGHGARLRAQDKASDDDDDDVLFAVNNLTVSVPSPARPLSPLVSSADAYAVALPSETQEERVLWRDVSLTLRRDMRLLITGPTGCGKSSLLLALSRHLRNRHREGGGRGREGGSAIGIVLLACVLDVLAINLFS